MLYQIMYNGVPITLKNGIIISMEAMKLIQIECLVRGLVRGFVQTITLLLCLEWRSCYSA